VAEAQKIGVGDALEFPYFLDPTLTLNLIQLSFSLMVAEKWQ